MDSGNPEMTSSFLSSDEGASQQSSLRSGRSLLERIQLQREREQANTTTSNAPQQINVPNYTPVPMEGHGNNSAMHGGGGGPADHNTGSGGGLFQTAWSQLSSNGGDGGHEEGGDTMGDALLPPNSPDALANQEYSMGNYFLTFVKDVYGLFMAMHVVLRVLVVLFLLYVAVKLL